MSCTIKTVMAIEIKSSPLMMYNNTEFFLLLYCGDILQKAHSFRYAYRLTKPPHMNLDWGRLQLTFPSYYLLYVTLTIRLKKTNAPINIIVVNVIRQENTLSAIDDNIKYELR